MDDNVEDCPVCLTAYDDTPRRPHNLPCGHTLCTLCINELKEQGAIVCPTCRASHAVPEAGQFPISYAVEGLVKMVKKLRGARLTSVPPKPGQQTALAPETQPAPKERAGLSRRAQSTLQAQETKVQAAIHMCQEEQSQLAHYLTTLGGWAGRQQQLEDKLLKLVDQSKDARKVVHREESRVEGKQEEVQEREQQLHVVLQALRTAATWQESYKSIEDADRLLEEESHRTEECLGVLPDIHVVTTVTRVAEASRAALQAAAATQATLKAASTAAAAERNPDLQTVCARVSSIVDKLQPLLAPPLTAKDLLSLKQPASILVEAGLIFAVQDVEGQSLHSRVSLEDGRLHLYNLQDHTPPLDAITLPIGEVVPTTPPCKVFLDLAWPGSAARRVVVSLPRNNAWGRQFILLCTGQRGACYANTRLLQVRDKGQPGEYLIGGDYERGDGVGGAALLPDLKHGDYWESGKAGTVLGLWHGDSARGAQFGILARDFEAGGYYIYAFGEVVQGLQVVTEAAQHRPVTEVTVVQCGVLLSK